MTTHLIPPAPGTEL